MFAYSFYQILFLYENMPNKLIQFFSCIEAKYFGFFYSLSRTWRHLLKTWKCKKLESTICADDIYICYIAIAQKALWIACGTSKVFFSTKCKHLCVCVALWLWWQKYFCTFCLNNMIISRLFLSIIPFQPMRFYLTFVL